jgi:cytochrome b561
MGLINTKARYGKVAVALHWVMALMVMGMYTLGLYMTGLEYMDPWYEAAPHIHKSIGFSVFTLLVLRTFWMLVNVKPEPLPGPVWERKAARRYHKRIPHLHGGRQAHRGLRLVRGAGAHP